MRQFTANFSKRPSVFPPIKNCAVDSRQIGAQTSMVYIKIVNIGLKMSTYIEYRGYTLNPVQQSPGWRVCIYPGPHLLRTDPAQVSAITREEALAKARATVDYHFVR
jgi:hypothetical protein